MAKIREKTVDVVLNEDGDGETVKITVKRPSSSVMSEAQRVAAKSWTECVRDGIMTKKELSKFMRQQGIWDKSKDSEQDTISKDIAALERKLYIGGKSSHTLKASEAKDIAIEMRQKRAELRDLITERMSLEANTADALSDNSRFDFLVYKCTYNEDGQLVYKSLDDYNEKSDGQIAFAAASALAEMMYSIDKDFESNLPENKFLKEFNFVNEDLSLVNSDGKTVDLEGRLINILGQYVDGKGSRVDKDGNKLDEDGNYVASVKYLDDSGKELTPKTKAKKPIKRTKKQKSTESTEEDG